MNRTQVIQQIINHRRSKNYLEIGVNNGVNFFRIKAENKVGVDPAFCFNTRRRVHWLLRNPSNWGARLFEMTSDDYFKSKDCENQVDVAFIDGLHTHEQSLKDVLNVLDRLSPGGVIVMHDCNPPTRASSTPASSLEIVNRMNVPEMSDAWCGDVWKTILYLRSRRNDLSVFVLDCDYGLGIVTKSHRTEPLLSFSDEELNSASYDVLESNRKNFLNLREASYLTDFLYQI